MKKSITLIAVVAFAALLLLPASALANAGIHGNYTLDTDACAGCHRAHTSVSSLTWSKADGTEGGSALLVSNATKMYQFCYACHDSTGQGADTNVQDGIYEGTLYGSQNTTLNGGGFDYIGDNRGNTMTSRHYIDAGWIAFGGGLEGQRSTGATGNDPIGGPQIEMSCTSCHDPHGSSNYRSLNDKVFGNTVGGYVGGINATYSPTPDPYVLSTEYNYPVGGFSLHTGYPTYKPNFTTPRYAKGPSNDPNKGMSGWCAGCHATYNAGSDGTPVRTKSSTYNAGDGFGYQVRHRHPINREMSTFLGDRSLIVTDLPIPLAHDIGERLVEATPGNTSSDWIECLTCHYAHGSTAVMTGYSSVDNVWTLEPDTGGGSVPPDIGSALLRLNNRGVCEVCHNK